MPFSTDSWLGAVADRAVYHVPLEGRFRNRLFVADLSTGTSHRIPLSLGPGEEIEHVATDGGNLVLLVWRRVNPLPLTGDIPCNGDEDHPLVWRLLAAPLSHGLVAGSFRVLDAGRSVLVFWPAFSGQGCAGPLVPQLAVASGRVAYAIEHLSSAQPAGSRILVRSLASGAILRTVTRPRQVVALALSDTTIAWSESDNLVDHRPQGWAVRRASIAGGASTEVNVGVHSRWPGVPFTIALAGSAVVLNVPGSRDDYPGPVERIASSGSVLKLNPPGAWTCWLEGTSGVTVALTCQSPAQASAGEHGVFLLWRSGAGIHPVRDVTEAVAGRSDARELVGPTSIAWHVETATRGSLTVVRLADLRWP